ncbi:MAG: hypothetical protein JJ974_12930 [Phycisphaerales bacterium]|nr:hypothetical protein [Phycisphaerales bacterium]
MQAVNTATDLFTTLRTQLDAPLHRSLDTDNDSAVITPSTPRWTNTPLCDGPDDLDEDEAYFLDDDDDDDEDDEYDEDDDDYDDDLDDDDDELDHDDDYDDDDF